ncbi:hypothetical protein DL768_008887 [Monosporascus sp. mg162]|nr:hypothetical protein DL768_008887 [Monosporascus sp. mg162]
MPTSPLSALDLAALAYFNDSTPPPDFLGPGAWLTVHVVDPTPPGPSLYTWATEAEPGLGPNSYLACTLCGRYLEWVFSETVRTATPVVEVVMHAARTIRLGEASDGRQILTLSTGRTLSGLAAILLVQGHLPLSPHPEQEDLTMYAQRHGLRHVPPANPADINVSSLGAQPRRPLHRTSRAYATTPLATSHAYAGSCRAIPYHAHRGNSKGPYDRHIPLVLTDEVTANSRKRANSRDALNLLGQIWPLVAKEVETVYYEGVLGRHASGRPEFWVWCLAALHNSPLKQPSSSTNPASPRPTAGTRHSTLCRPSARHGSASSS